MCEFASGLAFPGVAAAAEPASATPAVSQTRIRRFAFLAGANDGGTGRPHLRYATSDARSIARVLRQMGGVAEADIVFLAEPDRAAFMRGLDRIRDLVAASRGGSTRSELIFYYSGHSDEEGLLLQGERLGYVELRARIEKIPADVRVAVLDSCASGALTRGKGGVLRPPFMTDDSVKVTGHAFLTSSSADEVAQESDRIAASFFTHYLVSGLRGAADANRDGRVTFFEAYQFASQETLARTERTRGGAQHAAYDIQLNGTGDLVITDVRAISAGLILNAELQGPITVREPDGRLVAELRKAPGHPVELGIEPGTYVVTMVGAGASFEARIELRDGQRTEIGKLQFQAGRPLELAQARGGDGATAAPAAAPDAAPAATIAAPASGTAGLTAKAAPPPRYRLVPFSLGIVPMPSAGPEPEDRLIKNVAIALGADRAARINGFQASIGVNWADEGLRGMQAAVGANISGGPVHGWQTAVGGNFARGDLAGAQTASGVNIALGRVRGAQGAAGANYLRGALSGVQAAAGANVTLGEAHGAQAAAGANWANGDMTGVQLAAGFNGVRGTMSGAQIGIVNYGGDVGGAQIGIVNVAGKSRALQLGLVNVSDEDQGAPIGLVSVARKNGILNLDVFGNETSFTNAALKVGGRAIYTTFIFGYRPDRSDDRYATGIGLGGRFRIGRPALSFIDADAVGTTFTHDFSDQHGLQLLSTARIVGGWQLASHMAIIAGPTLNVLVARPETVGGVRATLPSDIAPGFLDHVLHDGATRVSMYPGLTLGIQI